MGRVVALCGKGGVGKTTVAAIAAKLLAGQKDRRTLLVDADPAGGLGLALGLQPTRTVNDLRRTIIEQLKTQPSEQQDLAAAIDFWLAEALVERGNLAFLSIGRPEDPGCYCAVNSLLREAVELLAARFDLTVIDAEAGLEQVNREVMKSVDVFVLVADHTIKSLRVAEAICQVARKQGSRGKAVIVLNRLRRAEEAELIADKTDLELAGWIPEDENIRRHDAEGLSIFDMTACPAVEAVQGILQGLSILSIAEKNG